MSSHDVIVLGAGLAGLSAGRDLALAGADVLILEARDRPGGRVQQATGADGRLVQLGGEIIGTFHTAYRQLARELGLTLIPSFVSAEGETRWVLSDGSHLGDDMPWMSAPDRGSYQRAEEQFARLSGTVDPDRPLDHPQAAELDRQSVASWLRSVDAAPAVLRMMELKALCLGDNSVERTSFLGELACQSMAGAHGFYDFDVWENERVAEGSGAVPIALAEQLTGRIRYGSAVSRIDVSTSGVSVTLWSGPTFQADIVVCALPVAALPQVQISGVSRQRLDSLARQRPVMAAKFVAVYEDSFWEDHGCNGSAYLETNIIAGVWPQDRGILSGLIPPDRLGAFFGLPAPVREAELLADLAAAFGPRALQPEAVYVRDWASDPWSRCYVSGWGPGDITAVGPLHGTSEPPFYVCGADHWISGYMEGAVRTGRKVAADILGPRTS